MDLADVRYLSRCKNKYKFLLNVIDVFPPHAWSVLSKDKTEKSIATALTNLFQNRNPITIQSDKGTEFLNATVQQHLKRQGVDFHTTHNPGIIAAVFERFNRTLKTKMYKYFTKNNTNCYLYIINVLLASYNNSVHSAICMPPSKVEASNVFSVWRKVISLWARIAHGRVKFKVGELVRITKRKLNFVKG